MVKNRALYFKTCTHKRMAAITPENWDSVSYAVTVPYIPPITRGKVVKVYDGDTITVASKVPGSDTWYRFSVRLAGIDCPEIKSKTASEKQVAQLAKQFVISQIMDQVVTLENVEMEKYGRLLAQVWYEDSYSRERLCLNEELCKRWLAVAYNGGTKTSPEDWREYLDKGAL